MPKKLRYSRQTTTMTPMTITQAACDAPGRSAPTHVRYGVLAFAAALSMVTYLDRVCISSGQSNGWRKTYRVTTWKKTTPVIAAISAAQVHSTVRRRPAVTAGTGSA